SATERVIASPVVRISAAAFESLAKEIICTITKESSIIATGFSLTAGVAQATHFIVCFCSKKDRKNKTGPKGGFGTKGHPQNKPPQGGAYRYARHNNGGEVHHMPADASSSYNRTLGPSFWMEDYDHDRTPSHGGVPGSGPYRE